MIIEEIKNIKSDCKELKKFGLQVGTVLLILGIILSLFGTASSPIFLSLGGALILTGYYFPLVLLPLQKTWMVFSVLMGFVMTRVILAILFYFVITPISFLSKLFRKDFLNLKIEKEKKSYWNLRDEEYEKSSTEKQF
jgi:Saxitoxin biosynthesis operon protein SxtJ